MPNSYDSESKDNSLRTAMHSLSLVQTKGEKCYEGKAKGKGKGKPRGGGNSNGNKKCCRKRRRKRNGKDVKYSLTGLQERFTLNSP